MMKVFEGLNWVAVLGIVIAVETQISNGTMSIAHSFPIEWQPIIKEWMGNLASVGGLMVAAGAFGPRPQGQFTITPAVKSAIALAFTVGLLMSFGGDAHAQTRKLQVTGNIAADTKANFNATNQTATSPADLLQSLMDKVSKIAPQIITNVVNAIKEADADAATLTNPADPTSFRDPISHACYPAQIQFLQSLPQVQAISSPAPYNLIVLFQRKRDLVAQIKLGLPSYLKVGCAAMLQDEKTIFIQTVGLIGVTVGAGALTGVFPAAAPLALPALTL